MTNEQAAKTQAQADDFGTWSLTKETSLWR